MCRPAAGRIAAAENEENLWSDKGVSGRQEAGIKELEKKRDSGRWTEGSRVQITTTRNWSRGRVNFRRVPSGNASTFAATCYRPSIINFPSLRLSRSHFVPFPSFAFIIYEALTKFTRLPLQYDLEFSESVWLVESWPHTFPFSKSRRMIYTMCAGDNEGSLGSYIYIFCSEIFRDLRTGVLENIFSPCNKMFNETLALCNVNYFHDCKILRLNYFSNWW